MEEHPHLWHYFAAIILFAVLGAIWHLARGLWRPIPEQLTGSKSLDLYLPTGFSITDLFHQVEFDEDGFYVLESWRNLRVAIGLVVGFGMLLMLLSSDVASAVGMIIDWMIEAFWDLVAYRWKNLY